MAAKFQKLQAEYEYLLSEYNTLKGKLECKTEALIILSQEQERYRSERDQYKLMADQLRERYSALKKRVEGWGPSLIGVYDIHGVVKGEREQSLVQLLCELKEKNKALQRELNDLREKLSDALGDLKAFREERNRMTDIYARDEDLKEVLSSENQILVKHLEVYNNKYSQLERDLQAICDEKEDLVTTCDTFRHKFERLNQQLNCLLRGDQHSYVDIDGVIMENKYLQERLKQIVEEKNLTATALSKCRALLEKKQSSGGFKLSSLAAGLAVSAKQVEQLLQNNHFLDKVGNSKNSVEFRNLVMTLLEALSDKSLALSHQTKTNKILGRRIGELEQKIKSLEATTLWQFHEKGRLKYLNSISVSEDDQSLDASSPKHLVDSIKDGIESSSTEVSKDTNDSSPVAEKRVINNITDDTNFSDLDILPSKECSALDFRCSRHESVSSSPSHISDSPFLSPRAKSYHSSYESTPKKSPIRTMSLDRCSSVNCSITEHSSLDLDLPPKLQKLLFAAFAELENNPQNDEPKSTKSSPSHPKSKENDPNC